MMAGHYACGYKWQALWQSPPVANGGDGKVHLREQECVLPKNHDGVHRSATNVIVKNDKEK
jgi:hypothetical protein